MLTRPTINELLDKIDNRYQLVLVVAKRARQLSDGSLPLTKIKEESNVSIAAHEVNEEKVYVVNK